MKLIQFGAGNIGRSFVGQIFARAGYEVVFVDIDETIVNLLNEHHRYPVEVRDRVCETIWVEGVRAVNGRDSKAVAQELANGDCAATAVGPAALRFLYPVIAEAIQLRVELTDRPLDIILCENLRNAASIVRDGVRQHLPEGFIMESVLGFVETSIGKMVPIITEEQRRANPLAVYAEAYNTLICDRRGFKGPIPEVPQLDPKENMAAYVDRKLFIHNLGHAVTAYRGFLADPNMRFIWEAVERPEVRKAALGAMVESAAALVCEYPGEFTHESHREHIEDLLSRFANQALGDTIYRVGRDLRRKLSPEDRLIGALRLDMKQGVEAWHTIEGIAAALCFRATDETGNLLPGDRDLLERCAQCGLQSVLKDVAGLDSRDPEDNRVLSEIAAIHAKLKDAAGAA